MGIVSFLKPNKAKVVFIVLFAVGISMAFLSMEILFAEMNKYFEEVEELTGESIGSGYLYESVMVGVRETYALLFVLLIIIFYIVPCFLEKFVFGLSDYKPWPIKRVVPLLLIIGISTFTFAYLLISVSPIPAIIPSLLSSAAIFVIFSDVFLFQRILAKEYEENKRSEQQQPPIS